MTRYERDRNAILGGDDTAVRERKTELDRLYAKGRAEKNGFRRQCIAQEYKRLEKEYISLSELI